MHLEIENNLIVGAEVELSINSSERCDDIELIVIHCISLPEGEYSNNYPKDLFLNRLDFNIHPSFHTLKDLNILKYDGRKICISSPEGKPMRIQTPRMYMPFGVSGFVPQVGPTKWNLDL